MRALRTVLACLLILAASGAAPVAVTCLAPSHTGCDETCTRCRCKRPIDGAHIRSICPCCGGDAAVPELTLPPSAVLPDVVWVVPEPSGPTDVDRSPDVGLRSGAVPDPPPRFLLRF